MRQAQRAFGLSALFAFAAILPAPDTRAAVTLDGNAPTGSTLVLQKVEMRGVTQVLRFKFTAGAPGSTVGGFRMGFCFQDPTNTTAAPCGAAGEYVVMVEGGTSALAVVPAHIMGTRQLVVVNPTSSTIPFSVEME